LLLDIRLKISFLTHVLKTRCYKPVENRKNQLNKKLRTYICLKKTESYQIVILLINKLTALIKIKRR